jgi:hypothetical protein
MVAVMMECPALVTGCQRSISRSARDTEPRAAAGVDGLDLVPTRRAAGTGFASRSAASMLRTHCAAWVATSSLMVMVE